MRKIKMSRKAKDGKLLNKIDLLCNLCYFLLRRKGENKY